MDSATQQQRGANLHEYFQNTFHQRLVRQSEEQKYDATMLTPATRLLQKQREMSQVEANLQIQKQEHQYRMEKLYQRKDALQAKEQRLTMSLLRFDRFLKENDARRKRALRKTRDEREACVDKDQEIQQCTVELAQLRKVREEQRKAIGKQQFYETYLRSVLKSTDEFSEIAELIDRYVTLSVTNKDLVELDNECQRNTSEVTSRASRNREEHRVKVLSYNTKLGELTARMEKAQKQTLLWEGAAQTAESSATKRTLLLGRIRMATANLYALVNSHGGSSTLDRIPNTEKQLDKIQLFIKDLEDVVIEFEADMMEEVQTVAMGERGLSKKKKAKSGSSKGKSKKK